MKKVIVVMPAYNAEKTVADTYNLIPPNSVHETILVDDCSKDKTVEKARELNIKVIPHPHNVGYGGNQKTCYMEAIRDNADIVIMLHPDGQYDPTVIPDMIKKITEDKVDIVLGSRFILKGGARKGGMPYYKYLANVIASKLQNFVLGLNISEFHTGYRAYTIELLKTVPFLRNSNDFDFDSQMLIQSKIFGFKFGEVPIKTRYFKDASSINLYVGVRYGVKTFFIYLQYILYKLGILKPPIFLP